MTRVDVRKSVVTGLLPSVFFSFSIMCSCVCVCTACVKLKDRVTGQDVYLCECSDVWGCSCWQGLRTVRDNEDHYESTCFPIKHVIGFHFIHFGLEGISERSITGFTIES